MQLLIRIILILGILPIFGCAFEPSNKKAASPNSHTQIFTNYLQNQFEVKIPVENHYYIYIANKSCIGCKKGGLQKYAVLASRNDVTLLTSVDREEREHWLKIQEPKQILVDSTGLLDRLNLPLPSNAAIINTKNGKIEKILNFDFSNYEPVFNSTFNVKSN